MSLTAILRDAKRRELAHAVEPGNAAYLVREGEPGFRHLSELSEVSFDTFARADMAGLAEELERVRATRTEPAELAHLDALIGLARRAQALEGATLTFAPTRAG